MATRYVGWMRRLLESCLIGAATTAAVAADDVQTGESAATVPVEEVIVTAQRRESGIQDTPIAVSAFSQQTIQDAHVNDLAGLQLGDPAVSFHVDEVYSPRPQGATILMYDLERVEVLRGPQGTLFGRNSTAGTVNVVTAKPALDGFDAYADLTVGDYNLIATRGMLNMPLSSEFGVRIAVATERHDGYIDFQPRSSVVHSRKYQAADQEAVRATALWQPNDRWRTTAAIDYFNDNGTGNIAVMQTPRAGQELRSALVDTAGFLDQDSLNFRLRTDFELTPQLELSYIGGYTEMERANASDIDAGTNPGFKQEHRTEWSSFESYSHELNLKSAGDGRFEWITGAYLVHEDNSIRFDIDIAQVAAPPEPEVIVVNPTAPGDTAWAMSFIQPKRTLDSQAAFAQATFGFTDTFRVTAGARYTEEDKEDVGGRNWVCPNFGATVADGGHLIGPGGVVSVATCDSAFAPGTWPGGGANDGQTSDEKTTYLVRGEFDLDADSLLYVSSSTGFKSGGLSDGGRRHLPEELTSYELGWKSALADGRLALNVAAFYMDYQDLQVSAVERLPSGQQQLVTSNAAAASIKGVELEFGWKPSDRDSLTGFASWLDAKYDDFSTIDTTYFDANNFANTVNLAGQPLRHAPDFSLTGIYEHKFSLANGASLVPRITFHYETDSTISPFNDVYPSLYLDEGIQEAYTKTDVALRYNRGDWSVEGFVLNVEDEDVKTDIVAQGNSSNGTPTSPPTSRGLLLGFYNPPRTWGIRLNVNF
jgi:iron complex outermembrane recepter protein